MKSKVFKNEIKRIDHVHIDDIKSMSRGYFFSKDSMRFFNSRLSSYGYRKMLVNEKEIVLSNHIFFVTSEKFDWKSKRLYTVRRLNSQTGEIITIGEFQSYKSSNGANRKAESLAFNDDF